MEALDADKIFEKRINICYLEPFLANSTQIFTRSSSFFAMKDSERQIFRKLSENSLFSEESEFMKLKRIDESNSALIN